MTALKWVLRCCPELPRSLVQKLFRLRQVRREFFNLQVQEQRRKRVAAKELMNVGDQILLPITVEKFHSRKEEHISDEEEMHFLHSLVLYKDPAIIVLNKPPGMPVQGGSGIKRSLDELASKYLKFDYSEPPRLVHRLDRDCSGILVMGRSQLSATVLHSIFREKTFAASDNDIQSHRRILQKRYDALVLGVPRQGEGCISLPLGKVVMDNGRSERITVADDRRMPSVQSAITEYRIVGSSSDGYTWLELFPLTGRKHQVRVHCAEVLGTPIVGDYKYGWQTHRKQKQACRSIHAHNGDRGTHIRDTDPLGLELGNGSISDKQPRLHLHCREMILPDISLALKHANSISENDLSNLKSIRLEAPLPLHMQMSWTLLQ